MMKIILLTIVTFLADLYLNIIVFVFYRRNHHKIILVYFQCCKNKILVYFVRTFINYNSRNRLEMLQCSN